MKLYKEVPKIEYVFEDGAKFNNEKLAKEYQEEIETKAELQKFRIAVAKLLFKPYKRVKSITWADIEKRIIMEMNICRDVTLKTRAMDKSLGDLNSTDFYHITEIVFCSRRIVEEAFKKIDSEAKK